MDESGAPVPGAIVSIVKSSVPMPEIALVANDGGRVGMRLPSGRFTLRAHGAGGSGETEVTDEPTFRIVIGD